MRSLVIFTALFSLVISGPVSPPRALLDDEAGLHIPYLLVETGEGEYEIEDLVNSEVLGSAEESDTIFWFFSQDNPRNGIAVNRTSTEDLRSTSFSASRDTVFIIHGWGNTNESSFVTTVREAAVNALDVNVFVVDWSVTAAQNYVSAKAAVVPVGVFVADFVNTLVATHGLSLAKLTIVGHSLGAHVAGNAGAALKGLAAIIVGLDPALPLFTISNTDERLDPTDADFVQIIHTNGGLKGFAAAIGDSDYFPNGGGLLQPGCGLDLTGTCSHARAYEYYAESLSSDGFVAVACSSYRAFSAGECSSNAVSVMGTYNVDKSAFGSYYLDTNSQPPFAAS